MVVGMLKTPRHYCSLQPWGAEKGPQRKGGNNQNHLWKFRL